MDTVQGAQAPRASRTASQALSPNSAYSGNTGRSGWLDGYGNDAKQSSLPKAQSDFANNFSQAYYDELYKDPTQITQSWFNLNNLDRNSGGLAIANQNAGNMPLMWMVQNGAGANETRDYLEWADDYLANQFTPGAQGITAYDVANALFDDNETNPIFQQLRSSQFTPAQQVDAFTSTFGSGMQGRLASTVLDSMLERLEDYGRNFTSWRATHADGGNSFIDYLRQQGFTPDLFRR